MDGKVSQWKGEHLKCSKIWQSFDRTHKTSLEWGETKTAGFLWIMLAVFLILSLWQNAKILLYWRDEGRNGWSAETPCIHHICTNLTKIQVKKLTFWAAELNSCCKECREPLMLLRSRAPQEHRIGVFYRLSTHACCFWWPEHSEETAKPRGAKVRRAEEGIKTQLRENDSAAEAERQRPQLFFSYPSLSLSRDEH